MRNLRYLVDINYIALAFIASFVIGFIMVIIESFNNFPTIVSSLQLYLVATILMMVIYHYMWDVSYSDMANILVRSLAFIIIPIGLFWSFVDGYTSKQLTSLEWLFTHDMIYVILVSQLVIMEVMIIGMKRFVVVREEKQMPQVNPLEEEIQWL